MGLTYAISSKYNLCYVKAAGEVQGEDILKIKKLIYSDSKWRLALNQIIDFSHVGKLILTNEDIERIIVIEESQEKKIKDEKRKVALVSNNDLYKAIFKYYEIRLKKMSYKTKVFKSIDRALDWIGLDVLPYSLIHHG